MTIIRHLDDEVLAANPKPFFGYSDNTNLLHHLYHLHGQGGVAFHGGSVLVHLGRPGAMHPLTLTSLRAALFTEGWHELVASPDYSDEPLDWSDLTTPGALEKAVPPMFPATGWHWHLPGSTSPAASTTTSASPSVTPAPGSPIVAAVSASHPAPAFTTGTAASAVIEGPVWGGNLEIISWLAAADRLAPPSRFSGHILLLETSEETPSDVEVYRMLRNLGERGLLAAFSAVLVGRAKAWDFGCRRTPSEKAAYAAAQRAAIVRAFTEYGRTAVDIGCGAAVGSGGAVAGSGGAVAGVGGPVIVFDLDVGHTDPQLIVPIGGLARIDIAARRVHVHY